MKARYPLSLAVALILNGSLQHYEVAFWIRVSIVLLVMTGIAISVTYYDRAQRRLPRRTR